jgi:hypothetical protein
MKRKENDSLASLFRIMAKYLQQVFSILSSFRFNVFAAVRLVERQNVEFQIVER